MNGKILIPRDPTVGSIDVKNVDPKNKNVEKRAFYGKK